MHMVKIKEPEVSRNADPPHLLFCQLSVSLSCLWLAAPQELWCLVPGGPNQAVVYTNTENKHDRIMYGTFCHWMEHFVKWDVWTLGTFAMGKLCHLGCFMMERFVHERFTS